MPNYDFGNIPEVRQLFTGKAELKAAYSVDGTITFTKKEIAWLGYEAAGLVGVYNGYLSTLSRLGHYSYALMGRDYYSMGEDLLTQLLEKELFEIRLAEVENKTLERDAYVCESVKGDFTLRVIKDVKDSGNYLLQSKISLSQEDENVVRSLERKLKWERVKTELKNDIVAWEVLSNLFSEVEMKQRYIANGIEGLLGLEEVRNRFEFEEFLESLTDKNEPDRCVAQVLKELNVLSESLSEPFEQTDRIDKIRDRFLSRDRILKTVRRAFPELLRGERAIQKDDMEKIKVLLKAEEFLLSENEEVFANQPFMKYQGLSSHTNANAGEKFLSVLQESLEYREGLENYYLLLTRQSLIQSSIYKANKELALLDGLTSFEKKSDDPAQNKMIDSIVKEAKALGKAPSKNLNEVIYQIIVGRRKKALIKFLEREKEQLKSLQRKIYKNQITVPSIRSRGLFELENFIVDSIRTVARELIIINAVASPEEFPREPMLDYTARDSLKKRIEVDAIESRKSFKEVILEKKAGMIELRNKLLNLKSLLEATVKHPIKLSEDAILQKQMQIVGADAKIENQSLLKDLSVSLGSIIYFNNSSPKNSCEVNVSDGKEILVIPDGDAIVKGEGGFAVLDFTECFSVFTQNKAEKLKKMKEQIKAQLDGDPSFLSMLLNDRKDGSVIHLDFDPSGKLIEKKSGAIQLYYDKASELQRSNTDKNKKALQRQRLERIKDKNGVEKLQRKQKGSIIEFLGQEARERTAEVDRQETIITMKMFVDYILSGRINELSINDLKKLLEYFEAISKSDLNDRYASDLLFVRLSQIIEKVKGKIESILTQKSKIERGEIEQTDEAEESESVVINYDLPPPPPSPPLGRPIPIKSPSHLKVEKLEKVLVPYFGDYGLFIPLILLPAHSFVDYEIKKEDENAILLEIKYDRENRGIIQELDITDDWKAENIEFQTAQTLHVMIDKKNQEMIFGKNEIMATCSKISAYLWKIKFIPTEYGGVLNVFGAKSFLTTSIEINPLHIGKLKAFLKWQR